MQYKEFPIHPELVPFVQVIWMLESEGEESAPKEQIMPDGIVEAVFHYGEPWTTTVAGMPSMVQPKSFAISMMRKHVEIEPNGGKTGFFSVRFLPWGAYHFFSEPIGNFLDSTMEGGKLWPTHIDDMMERFLKATDEEERLHVVQDFLLGQLAIHHKPDAQLEMAVRLIRDRKGQVTITEVCEEVQVQKKQLERKFLSRVGTTPKVFARVMRFLNICQHLKLYEGVPLGQLAQDCGFYDQAHFIREFKEFSGYSPKEFYERNNVAFTEI